MNIGMAQHPRTNLAATWGLFALFWLVATYVSLLAVGPCRGDGGSLYGDPSATRIQICHAEGDYLSWGEPSVKVGALLPIVILIAIGVAGVWLRSARLLKRSAMALSICVLLYLVIPHVLP
jgi:hypothetical protein